TRRRRARRAASPPPAVSRAAPRRAPSRWRCRATRRPRRASAAPGRRARRRRALRDRGPRERVQLERGAPVRRRLDDVDAGATLDLLELEHDVAVVLPVEHEPLGGLGLAHDGPPLVAVVPAEDALAAGTGRGLHLVWAPPPQEPRGGEALRDP